MRRRIPLLFIPTLGAPRAVNEALSNIWSRWIVAGSRHCGLPREGLETRNTGKKLKGAYHDRNVCRSYESLSVVEALGHSRTDRWLLGSILCHSPDLHERATHPRTGHGWNGDCGVYRSRNPKGPGDLPQVRSHGARELVGPWGLPGS